MLSSLEGGFVVVITTIIITTIIITNDTIFPTRNVNPSP
jgi:hypothetical protein